MTEQTINKLIYNIRYQLQIGVTTMGVGECGHIARGSKVCIDCLEIKLADVVGAAKAKRFVEAQKESHAAQCALYEGLGV